ncbi:hypothetical protein RB213_011596 [Colletotrichum asianum]
MTGKAVCAKGGHMQGYSFSLDIHLDIADYDPTRVAANSDTHDKLAFCGSSKHTSRIDERSICLWDIIYPPLTSQDLYSSTKRDKPFYRFQNPTPDKFKYSAFLAISYWDRGRIPVDGIKTYMKSPDLRHPNREQ